MNGPAEVAAGGRSRSRARRRVRAAVGAAAVLLVVGAVVLLGVDRSRPAPPMTDVARAAGAIRLTYPNRRLPPPVMSFPLPGPSPVDVEFGDVYPGESGPVARFALAVHGGGRERVELAAGEQTDVLGVRVRVLHVYDGRSAKDDAADVVVEAVP